MKCLIADGSANGSVRFIRKDVSGFTTDLSKAKTFKRKEAIKLARTNDCLTVVIKSEMYNLANLRVDHLLLNN